MDVGISWIWAGVALAVGLAGGWMLGRGRGAGDVAERLERAERALKDETARAQSALAAAESRAKRNVAAVQAEMAARVEKLNAEHRAEHEKLALHLTEAYDELDRLRADAARSQRPGDSTLGFPPTLPLGNV